MDKQTNQSSRLNISSGGVFLVLIGVLLLLNTLNIVDPGIWLSLLPLLLPLIFIQIGVGILFSDSRLANMINIIILIGFVVFGIWRYQNGGFNYDTDKSTYSDSVSLSTYPDIEVVDLQLEVAMASLDLEVSPSEELIISSSAELFDKDNLFFAHSTTGNTLFLEYSSQGQPSWWRDFGFSPDRQQSYQIMLGQSELQHTVNLSNAFAQSKLDLQGLNLDSLKVDNSFGMTTLYLDSEQIPTSLNVSSSFGEVTLNVPKQLGLKINYDSSFGSITVDKSHDLLGEGVLEITGDSDQILNLDLESNFGTIKVSRY